jgi:molecular chaperone DnaJ
MAKNYYVTLGISRGADLNQIKRAYRKVAKKVHPDTAQSDDAQRFLEISEAYETLMDKDARRLHDASLEVRSEPVRISSMTEEIKRRTAPMYELKEFKSLVDEFFEGFIPGFFQKERLRSPQKDLYYEVILSPSEAMQGGLFPIRVPVFAGCPQCNQTGFWDIFDCPACGGRGHRQAEQEFSLSIPPRTGHNTEATVSLEDIGLPDVNLYVRVLIDPYLD